VGQAGEEADEGFLNDVLAHVAVVEPVADERQQPPLEARDELFPRGGVAGADALDQQAVAFGGHGASVGVRRAAGLVPAVGVIVAAPPPAFNAKSATVPVYFNSNFS